VAAPNSGNSFGTWTQTGGTGTAAFTDPGNASTTVTVSGAGVTIQASFRAQLTLVAGTGGTLTTPPSSPVTVTLGSPTAIVANPSSGYLFASWTTTAGSGVSFGDAGTTSTTVTLASGAATIRAGFAYSVLYVGSTNYADQDHISAYTVDYDTGALRQIAGSTIASGANPMYMTAHPTLNVFYCANYTGGSVSALGVDKTTGKATMLGSYGTGANTSGVVVDPAGKFLYTSNLTGNNVSAFSINQSDGTLTAVSGSPFAAGAYARGIGIYSGQYLYTAITGAVAGFSINATTGALTALAGSPFSNPASTGSQTATVTPLGFVLVANCRSPGTNSVFSINAGTGALTAVSSSPFSTTQYPTNPRFDSTGTYVYINHWNDNLTSAYSINGSTGALSGIGNASTGGTSPNGTAIDPTGRFLFVSNFNSTNVAVYSINSGTGQITAVTGSPFTTITGPGGMVAFHPK
jgi:6-phosphogluconolactonase (cycloisomerase 2 family)